jgi:acyl-[acyl-carrier-protein] desaturase
MASRKHPQIRRAASRSGTRLHHDEVIQPVLRFWRIFERNDFGPAGEHARDELSFFLVLLDAKAKHYEDKRATREAVRRTA